MTPSRHSPSGVLVIDKPGGITSHDVVNRVRRLYGTRRVGHAGTLDPMATGVLVVCLGMATRIVEYLAAGSKEYVAGVRFGIETSTQDTTGDVRAERDCSLLTGETVISALDRFCGSVHQVPPMVSARHHEGRRLYELARAGVEVERAARPVEITRLEMLSFRPGRRPEADILVECSPGTYIRTLAADMGQALGCGAAMCALRRTRSGEFRVEQAHTLNSLESARSGGRHLTALIRLEQALSSWPAITLSAQELARVAQGQPVGGLSGVPETGMSLLLAPDGTAAAIAELKGEGIAAPVKVFVEPAAAQSCEPEETEESQESEP